MKSQRGYYFLLFSKKICYYHIYGFVRINWRVNMKNKIISLSLITIMLIASVTGCGKKEEVPTNASGANKTITQVVVDSMAPEEEVVEYTFGPAELLCKIPEEFKETEYLGEYLTDDYPNDVSSINQVISESNEDPTQMTEEEFKAKIENEYHEGYGDDVTITITQYDPIVVSGRPGLWIMYNFDFRGEPYNVLMIAIYNKTESHYITYLQGPGSDWMTKFADSAVTLEFEEIG